MKRQLAILGLLACLITSTAASSVLMSDSKVIENRSMLVKENSSKIICLNFSNYSDNEVKNVDNKTNNTNNSNTYHVIANSTNDKNNRSNISRVKSSSDTVVIYGYPSSWQDTLPYKLYKTTWKREILNICEINPKKVYESELSRYSDGCDFSVVSGLEKDFNGQSIREYLIKVEVA